jgi:hypothetical protein
MPWKTSPVMTAHILGWDFGLGHPCFSQHTLYSVSTPCIHISAPNISYPVVIQDLPHFSHKNDKKNIKSGQNPFLPHFFKSLFTNSWRIQCYTVCRRVTPHQHSRVDALIWFRFGLVFYKVRLPVSNTKRNWVIHTTSLNFHVALSHWPLNAMLLY